MAGSGLMQLSNRLSPAGGVEVMALDLSQPLPSDVVETIRAAILAHHVANR
jgi:hypothetical protein